MQHTPYIFQHPHHAFAAVANYHLTVAYLLLGLGGGQLVLSSFDSAFCDFYFQCSQARFSLRAPASFHLEIFASGRCSTLRPFANLTPTEAIF